MNNDSQSSVQTIEGNLVVAPGSIAIVASRFNELVVSQLIEGAIDCYCRHGGERKNLVIIRVPGAFEIPIACSKLAQSTKYQAIVALGAVIRGSTPHFDYVASEVSKGVAQESLKWGLPISFGVLTTDDLEQALERAGSKAGNKGWDAMLGAIEMVSLLAEL